MKHRGPFVEDYESNPPREFNWPDEKAQVYFSKKISHHWRKKLAKVTDHDEDSLKEWVGLFAARV